MKIAELTVYILTHYADNAENYPTLLEPLAVTDELKIVEDLISHLQTQIEESYENEADFWAYDDRFFRDEVLQRDFTAKELCEALEEIYLSPEYPALDIWIEDVKCEYGRYAPRA